MKRIRRLLHGRSKGFTLVELIIAIALMGIIAVAFFGSLSNAMLALHFADVQTTAESLARSEIELVKERREHNAANYTRPDPTGYEGYSVSVGFWVVEQDQEEKQKVQRITVKVNHGDRGVISLTGYMRTHES